MKKLTLPLLILSLAFLFCCGSPIQPEGTGLLTSYQTSKADNASKQAAVDESKEESKQGTAEESKKEDNTGGSTGCGSIRDLKICSDADVHAAASSCQNQGCCFEVKYPDYPKSIKRCTVQCIDC